MSASGLENFANTVTVIAALGGVVIAGLGLSTWRKQIEFSTDSDLAKRMLVLLYRHFDALNAVRHPAIFSAEVERAIEGHPTPTEPSQKRYFETVNVYQRRFSKVTDIRAELYPLIIEGQAFWGREFRTLFDGLWALENELASIIRLFLDASDPDKSADYRQQLQSLLRSKRYIVYILDENSDEFSADYQTVLARVEDFLRAKLGRRPS